MSRWSRVTSLTFWQRCLVIDFFRMQKKWMLICMRSVSRGSTSAAHKEGSMEKAIINPLALARPRGYSHGIFVTGGRLLFLGGQAALDAQGQVVAQGDLIAQYE